MQDKLKETAFEICDMLVSQHGHFYVCGDVSMAADVCRTLQVNLEQCSVLCMLLSFLFAFQNIYYLKSGIKNLVNKI